jgi:general stress protein CsbA
MTIEALGPADCLHLRCLLSLPFSVITRMRYIELVFVQFPKINGKEKKNITDFFLLQIFLTIFFGYIKITMT